MKQPDVLVNTPATAASKSKRRMASLPAPKTAPPKPHRPASLAAWRPPRSLSSILGSERTAAPTAAVGLEEFIGCSGKKLEPGFVKDVQLGNLRFPICAFRSSHRFGTPILFIRSKHHGGLPV